MSPITGLRECDVAAAVGELVKGYLEAVGYEVRMWQSDNLNWDSDYADRQDCSVCDCANQWPADIFVSIHCNSAGNTSAQGTETLVHNMGGRAERLADCIQRQIVDGLDTVDRGLKERPELTVLRATDMPAVLVELAFISKDWRRIKVAKTKQVYMNPALAGLEADVKESGGSFSARLGEIVDRYGILLDLEELPDFSEADTEILSEVICGAGIDRRKIRGLHLDVRDVATGTKKERDALSAVIAEMSVGQRLALIEKMGQ